MTRALITDPDLPRKAARGPARRDPALHRVQRLHRPLPRGDADRLLQNPRTGRELHAARPRAGRASRKRLVVVGAGPAGLAAAAEARRRGPRGRPARARPGRSAARSLCAGAAPMHAETAATLLRELRAAARRRSSCGSASRPTPTTVAALEPDLVVVATGAPPVPPADVAGGAAVSGVGRAGRRRPRRRRRGRRRLGRRSVRARRRRRARRGRAAESRSPLAVGRRRRGRAPVHRATSTSSGSTGPASGSSTTSSSSRASGGAATFRNLFAPELETALPADARARARPRAGSTALAPGARARGHPGRGGGRLPQPALARGGDPRGHAGGARPRLA